MSSPGEARRRAPGSRDAARRPAPAWRDVARRRLGRSVAGSELLERRLAELEARLGEARGEAGFRAG